MATAQAMLERRRSSRISVRIPVQVSLSRNAQGEQLSAPAEAIGVSRCGALIRVPFAVTPGARLQVIHGRSREAREFRVVRVSERKSDGLFDLGAEILFPNCHNFWGVAFPDESASS